MTIKGSALSNPEEVKSIIKWISEKKIDPISMITDEYSLIDTDKAFKSFEKNALLGKVIINCADNIQEKNEEND